MDKEIDEEKTLLNKLREAGFYESYVQEIRQMACNRHLSTHENYIDCLKGVCQEELSQITFAVVHDENNVEIIHSKGLA